MCCRRKLKEQKTKEKWDQKLKTFAFELLIFLCVWVRTIPNIYFYSIQSHIQSNIQTTIHCKKYNKILLLLFFFMAFSNGAHLMKKYGMWNMRTVNTEQQPWQPSHSHIHSFSHFKSTEIENLHENRRLYLIARHLHTQRLHKNTYIQLFHLKMQTHNNLTVGVWTPNLCTLLF